MPIERVYLFHCRTTRCDDYAVLPRQSHLGKFDDQLDPAKDIWPINYLCQTCGLVSEVQAEAIHPEDVEMLARSPLIWYEFSNGQPNSLVRFSIYSKEADHYHKENPTIERIVETVLKPSGLWLDSFGPLKYVAVDSRILTSD